MKKNILAVCDMEITYAYNFMEYLNQKKSVPFEIQAFSNVENLKKFMKDCPIEILLISDKTMTEEIRAFPISQIIILSEGGKIKEFEEYPQVYKYQSSETVIREVMTYYGTEEVMRNDPTIRKKKTKIIGIYSPLGRCCKTQFALTLGQVLAKNKAVLYLNLESYAGFEELFGVRYEKNLSDLLYYMRQDKNNLIYRLSSMIHTIQKLDYLPPALSPMDLQNTTYEEWSKLIREIESKSSYEILLMDVGDCIDDLYNFLGKCDLIYLPILTDQISQAKLKQFENLLRMWDCIPVLEKIQKIKLPQNHVEIINGTFAEDLMFGNLGDYIKDLIGKDSFYE